MVKISKKLLKQIKKYNIKYNLTVDRPLIMFTINFIKELHKNQTRYSGEPYYYHPIEVALIVIDYFFDTETIIAALLHDIVEDTNFSLNQINFLFGSKITLLIDRLTKLDNNAVLKLKLSKEENFCKLINDNDQKVFAIKLSDRLHNMRTIKYVKPIEKQKKIALETLQIFIPIAKYTGMTKIELELHELAVKTLNQYEDSLLITTLNHRS